MTARERLERFFGEGGTLARAHPGHESRPGQLALARDVFRALREGRHLVAEAGTGTGKTLAYVVPALALGRRVIVSTGTRALQDQLAQVDLPFLRDRCGLEFSWCTLKGRDNYLCVHRLEAFGRDPLLADRDEARAWPEVLRWAGETATGDVAELTGLPENPSFWRDVNARGATCLGSRCPRHEECHLQEVRRAAEGADIVVVNHHLFLADAALREGAFGQVLPELQDVIFDEAHRLEPAATSFFGRSVSTWRLRELAEDAEGELRLAGLSVQSVTSRAARLTGAAEEMARAFGQGEGRHVLPARLGGAREDALAGARAAVGGLGETLGALPHPPPSVEPLQRRCAEVGSDLAFIVAREDPAWVYWWETRGRGLHLTATPVDVSALLRERVFARLRSSVLTSATLAVDGSMLHVRRRLGLAAEAADPEGSGDEGLAVVEAIHDSPFDPARQGLLYLPRRMPQPRDPAFAAACAEQCLRLASASRGRAFLLFTSYENLRRVHHLIAGDLPHDVLVQGDAPKAELLRRFRERPSVLFATASFWEGVDVPGSALSLVVMDKLPFSVPTDPIQAARARLVSDRGGDAFRELSLPEAVLALKQGAGRLIRSSTDRGVVAVLDPRLTRAGYGRAFLANLPPLRRTSVLRDVEEFFAAERGAIP